MWPDWNDVFFQMAASASLRAIVLAAGVAATLTAMKVPRGGVRHAAWTAVVAAMLLMPLLTRIVPPIELPLPAAPLAIEPLADGVFGRAAPRASVDLEARPGTAVQLASAVAETAPGPGRLTLLPAPPTPSAPIGPMVVIGVYAAGVLFFFSRLVVGWILMRRLVRASRPWGRPGPDGSRAAIRESWHVATPLTVGVVTPLVILPTTWRSWPDEKLQAVLAHELAHVRRRDPFVTLVAFVNRAIFWFHPLAWWLERVLASHAEDACDGAAVRVVATPRRYAEVLMDMAESVRRSGSRVAWQGVGVDGTGLLGQRIDRILGGDVLREVSKTRKIVIGLGCALAIAIVAACRQPIPAPAPLEPDPELTERWAKEKTRWDEITTAREMTAAQAAELEEALRKNPEDSALRTKLQVFYLVGGRKAIGWNKTVAAKRRHILWLIEHHPGDPMTLEWVTIDPAYDPAGYVQAKKLWLAATSKKDVATPALSNAAYFFRTTDRPLAEQFWLRAQAQDPGGPTPREEDNAFFLYYLSWSARLGSLYASAIVGFNIDGSGPVVAQIGASKADRSLAREARRKLAETTDASMLVSAGRDLTRRYPISQPERIKTLDFDPVQLGASYLDRALQLDPKVARFARGLLVGLAANQRSRRVAAMLKGVPKDRQSEIILALPDAERIAILPERAAMQYTGAEYEQYTRHDAAAAKAAWALAKTYADDLLKLADTLPNDPHRGTAFFAAHVTLGALALHDNDQTSALRHMETAGSAPASDELRYNFNSLWSRLATGMLKRGERESVARFLERYAALNESGREQLLSSAAHIRAGRMPSFYQYQTVAH